MLKILSQEVRDWIGQQSPYELLLALEGETVRAKEGRFTMRFEINGHGYYVKYHGGVGWREIIKNLSQFRLPITSASNEWHAIQHLHAAGLDTQNAVAYGKTGLNPAMRRSFLITEELTSFITLEDLCADWALHRPDFVLRLAIIKKVASISRTLHLQGVNHRDLYICHFLLSTGAEGQMPEPDQLRIYLIDLHRAQIRRKVPARWLIKDIASLYFSSMDIGLTSRDIFRFLRVYFDSPLRQVLSEKHALLMAVEKRAVKLYRKDHQRDPSVLKKLPG